MNPYFRFFRISQDTDLATLRDQYLALCKRHHPDKGGQAETFAAMTEEYERACAYLTSRTHDQDKSPPNKPKQHGNLARDQLIADLAGLAKEYLADPESLTPARLGQKVKRIAVKAGIHLLDDFIKYRYRK
jgi:hypothetical protein